MNASKRKYLILVGIACLAVILALVLRREETLEEAARRVMASLRTGDAATLLRYAPREEVEMLDLNAEKVEGLWRAAWKPRIGDGEPNGDPEIQPYPVQNALRLTQKWRRSDGSEFITGILLVRSDEGVALDSLTGTIVLNSMISVWDTRQGMPQGAAKLRLIAQEIEDSIGSLSASGLDGFARARGTNFDLQRVTWQEMVESLRSLAEKVDAMERQAQKEGTAGK